MKIYFKVVLFILFVVSMFGFVLPALISSASTEAVMFGVFLFVCVGPVVVYSIYPLVNSVYKGILKNEKSK